MYYLKLFDKTLITFEMNNDYGLEISNISINEKNQSIFPTMLINNISENTLENYLKTRVIPKNRWFVEEILKSSGLNKNDIKGIIDICKGLSLNDCYWIVNDDKMKFADYNLYDNEFSETLALIAFTGYTSKIKGIITSPEYTTSGMLPKAWRRINNEVYLYKGSLEHLHYANVGYEPYSEYYASQIAKTMELDAVQYDLTRWKNMLCSTCKLFTSKKYSYVPIGYIINTGGLNPVSKFLESYNMIEEFADMIMFDALIYNPDRHYGNFGVLRNNYTGEYEKFAPIFDNGAGLFSKAMPTDFENIEKLNKFINTSTEENLSYYGTDYKKLVQRFCGKSQIAKLRKVLTFEFRKHPMYNLPDDRLKTLSQLVQQRASELIIEIEKSINNQRSITNNIEDDFDGYGDY